MKDFSNVMNVAVYLDHNASADLRPEARAAVERALALGGNGSSVHRHGRRVRAEIESARDAVAELCGVDRDAVVFTSGGTEANNQVVQGASTRRVLVSAVEHPSVATVTLRAEVVPVNRDGVVDLAALGEMLSENGEGALVCIMAANNETGVVQPVAEAAEVVRRAGAILHCDAVQAPGKIDFDARTLGAHTYAVSGHKIGAPAGVGALIAADPSARPDALIRGGGQERYHRSGTENLIGIAGFGAAAAATASAWREEAEHTRALRDELEQRLGNRAEVAGARAPRLPNTCNIILTGVESETQVMALDLAGISVSAGAACSSGKVRKSAVLDAMGYGEEEAGSAIRVSLGRNSTKSDIDAFVAEWSKLAERRPAAA